MKGKKLIGILSTVLAVMSISFANPSAANAEWRKDAYGWWNSKGSTWSIGWEKIDGSWYYFDENGYMVTGWIKSDGKWYFFNDDGAMSTGFKEYKSKEYYLDESGAMATGWIQYNGKWFYYNEDGSAKDGWLLYNSKWYYIANGVMVYDDVINGYEINHNGEWTGNKIEGLDIGNVTKDIINARTLIYNNDTDFISKYYEYNFKLGKDKETTIKDFIGTSYSIPDEKCHVFPAYLQVDSKFQEVFNYIVGKESGKIYALRNQGGFDTYEIKDNTIVNTYYYKDNIDESTEWRLDETDENIYTRRRLIKYDGTYLDNSTESIEDIKKKSSFTMDDALQMAIKNDSKMLYMYKNLNGLTINVKKGEELKCSGTIDGKWNIPKGNYYVFEVFCDPTATTLIVNYSYMVNKDTKDVYLVPKDETLPAYKMDNNIKSETYKCITNDSNHEWRN